MDRNSTEKIIEQLKKGNEAFRNKNVLTGEQLQEQRKKTVAAQQPHTVVITCADSRVSPEILFNAGIGELFVIRTAGNLIGRYGMESIAYAVEGVGAKVVLVMGHSGCGAVKATIDGEVPEYFSKTYDEIHRAIGDEKETEICEVINIRHGIKRILQNDLLRKKANNGEIAVIGGYYRSQTGEVEFLDD